MRWNSERSLDLDAMHRNRVNVSKAAQAFALAAFTLFTLAAAQSGPEETAPSRIRSACRKILSTTKESHYQHITHVDEDTGIYDVDCSGLLCYVLKKVAPEHYAAIPISKTHRRPLALQFYEAFASPDEHIARYWQTIHRLKDARPGDVLVWRKAEQLPGKDTGHVMIIDQPPVEDGKDMYRVTVIDSTESPHADDTRKDGATGVGRGTMWFLVDSDSRPTAYHWRLRNGKPREIEIAIGRAIDQQQSH